MTNRWPNRWGSCWQPETPMVPVPTESPHAGPLIYKFLFTYINIVTLLGHLILSLHGLILVACAVLYFAFNWGGKTWKLSLEPYPY